MRGVGPWGVLVIATIELVGCQPSPRVVVDLTDPSGAASTASRLVIENFTTYETREVPLTTLPAEITLESDRAGAANVELAAYDLAGGLLAVAERELWFGTRTHTVSVELRPACERTFTCEEEEPVTPACGDGVIDAGETCDDLDAQGEDGCSASCIVEDGWSCGGAPSVCTQRAPVCGDGAVGGAEACDDGEPADDQDPCDGCVACALVSPVTCGDGYLCAEEPCDGASAACDASCQVIDLLIAQNDAGEDLTLLALAIDDQGAARAVLRRATDAGGNQRSVTFGLMSLDGSPTELPIMTRTENKTAVPGAAAMVFNDDGELLVVYEAAAIELRRYDGEALTGSGQVDDNLTPGGVAAATTGSEHAFFWHASAASSSRPETRFFDKDGVGLGAGVFFVDDGVAAAATHLDVARSPFGTTTYVWRSRINTLERIYTRVYDAQHVAVGAEAELLGSAALASEPRVAMNDDGATLVAWIDGAAVRARLAPTPGAWGAVFDLYDGVAAPAVGFDLANDAGRFLMVVATADAVTLRQYDASAAPFATPVTVNVSSSLSGQALGRVRIAAANGRAVVGWENADRSAVAFQRLKSLVPVTFGFE